MANLQEMMLKSAISALGISPEFVETSIKQFLEFVREIRDNSKLSTVQNGLILAKQDEILAILKERDDAERYDNNVHPSRNGQNHDRTGSGRLETDNGSRTDVNRPDMGQ